MVKVSDAVYDNGGVGDGNLTQTTAYPGGGAAPRRNKARRNKGTRIKGLLSVRAE